MISVFLQVNLKTNLKCLRAVAAENPTIVIGVRVRPNEDVIGHNPDSGPNVPVHPERHIFLLPTKTVLLVRSIAL